MQATRSDPNIELVLRYHEAVGAFATGGRLARFFAPEMIHRELPNLLFPDGALRDVPAILAASEQGRSVLSEQTYEVLNVVSADDKAAAEVQWTGRLAVPYGGLPVGHVMRAHIGAFFDIRDGRISGQRNYDCYDRLKP
jgi:hypothetical protein